MPSRAQWRLWRSLARRKGREESGLFVLEGPHLLAELLASQDAPAAARKGARASSGSLPVPAAGARTAAARTRAEHVLHTDEVADDPGISRLLERCRALDLPVHRVTEAELAELADTVTPQGVLAVARIPRSGWADLTAPLLLVLDAIQDPGNLGTLARTAEAIGLGGLLCLPGTVDPWNAKAVRAAAGSTLRLPVLTLTWEGAHAGLRADGIPIWAADARGEPVRRADPRPDRLALALGNEARGLSPEVRRGADRIVSVPMAGRVESLNVAVAGAILMDRLFGDAHGAGNAAMP